VPHHFFVAHAAMLSGIMLCGVVTALSLMLLHHLAMPHHLFMAHGLVLRALGRGATTESRRRQKRRYHSSTHCDSPGQLCAAISKDTQPPKKSLVARGTLREIKRRRVIVLRGVAPEEFMSDLDKMLTAWSGRDVGADLSQIEPQVWARLSVEEHTSASGVLGFRAALVASVMTIGVIAGGAASATAEPEVSPFATHSAYAPSTLLEGGQ
jgi:hypothetical protein